MDAQEAFARVNTLIQSAPNANENSHEVKQWLARTIALLETFEGDDRETVKFVSVLLDSEQLPRAVNRVNALLIKASARLELKLPVEAQGAFIGIGNAMDAVAAVSKIFQKSKSTIRILDPYMDEKALTTFAVMAAEGIRIELLSDSATAKPAYSTTIPAWRAQYGQKRPIDARLSMPRAMHDRLIVIDNSDVYTVTQSLKDIAARSPASIIKVDAETASLKIPAYEAIWAAATPIP